MRRRTDAASPDSPAVRKLFDANVGLAVHLARKYARRYPRVNLQELVQDALLGLLRAAQLHDPTLGNPFAPYAMRGVLWAIWEHVNRLGGPQGEESLPDPDGQLSEDCEPGNDAVACELFWLIENSPELTDRERRILRLQYGDGLSVPEIARRIRRSPSIVSTESASGIRKLRAAVAGLGMPALAPGAPVKPIGTGRTRVRAV